MLDLYQKWVSPRLQIRFDLSQADLQIYDPDGSRFLTYVEIAAELDQERQRAEAESQRAESERQRAESERQRADELEQQLQQYRDRFGDLSP